MKDLNELMTVTDAIAASDKRTAVRVNPRTRRPEYAATTYLGIRIVNDHGSIVRKIPAKQMTTKGWKPYMCKHQLAKFIGDGKKQCCECGTVIAPESAA